jgi:hypothetical protein
MDSHKAQHERPSTSVTDIISSINPLDIDHDEELVLPSETSNLCCESGLNSTASTSNMEQDETITCQLPENNSWGTYNNQLIGTNQFQVLDRSVSPQRDRTSFKNADNSHTDREKCIVIHGIPESTAQFPNDRILADLDKFQRCLEKVLTGNEVITVRKAFRLGKLNTDSSKSYRPRPLKLILESEVQAQLLLKRKYMLKDHQPAVFFQPDYTQIERDKLKLTLAELRSRKERGERNLRILNLEIVPSQKQLLWQQPIIMRARCERKKLD